MDHNFLLSLVVPVYFEEECVDQFVKETVTVLERNDYNYELIFIDDGSEDNTVALIKNLIKSNDRIKLIELSYNHGKQAAVTAGITYATGDYIIYMDPDLQDPPPEIPRFVNEISKGYDLVFGVRKEKKDSFTNRQMARVFWWVLERFTGIGLPKGLAVMRIFNRSFADEFLKYSEQNRFIEGIFMKIRKRYTSIEIEQRERFAGTSKFNFSRKMKLAFDAIFDFSEIPLRMTIRFGMFLTILGLLALIGIIITKLFFIEFQSGWPSVFSLILTGFGVQLFFMGIISRYIANIYREVKRRPLFSIKNKVNLS